MTSNDRTGKGPSPDPFAHVDYRRMIAWPQRIEREAPFLAQQLAAAPVASVVDIGCGTGEHARFLASQGVRTVGIDRSPAQIDAARAYEQQFGALGPVFLHGEIADLPALTDERFGAALCLGNVLPSLDDETLPPALAGVAARLVAGGRLVIQLLNYHRILEQRVRHLPLSFRPGVGAAESGAAGGAEEVLFLRLMTPDGDRHVRFFPTTLSLHPGEDPPVRLVDTHETRVRAWRWEQLQPFLEAAGFGGFELFGDMSNARFAPDSSPDLVISATCGAPLGR